MKAQAGASDAEGSAAKAAAWRPRLATPEDNRALIDLTAACAMEGDIGLRVDRSPDFFALNRLEGKDFRVAVADAPGGGLAGCMAGAERLAYLSGAETRVMYVSDLKVRPDHRGSGAADALSGFIRGYCRERGGDHAPTVMTVLGGNAPMARRAQGPRGMPELTRFATLRAHNVSLLWKRKAPVAAGASIRRATRADCEEMAGLWRRVAPGRQFAAVFTPESLAAWVDKAPGLNWEDYLLARDGRGRLLGFVAFWDQDAFKQMRVVRYSRNLKLARMGFNLAAPFLRAAPLPPPGGALRYLTAVNLCVAEGRADVLRALIIEAYNASRGRGYAFLSVGLDKQDPLSAAFRGLMAQPTDIDALVTTPAGRYRGPALDVLPLHFETALV